MNFLVEVENCHMQMIELGEFTLDSFHRAFILCGAQSTVSVEEYLIPFVEKAARSTPWEHVTHLFCRQPDGGVRKMRYFDAIHLAKEGTAHFYAVHRGMQVALHLAHNAVGEECLRATIGGNEVDVLLSLPDYRDANR